MPSKVFLTRWINHILRSYQELKMRHNIENEFKEKFAKQSIEKHKIENV
jgi:hypothetical protein